MKRYVHGWFIVVTAGAVLAGCVHPGGIDPTIVNRYAEAMARKGPQHRAGSEGLDSLRPISEVGPQVRIVRDDETGSASVYLGLQEAIMLALANNLDIRVVSYDPAISREEMTIAAAEFDYVLFGSWGRSKMDEQTGVVIAAGQSEERAYELGLRQKTITGAQWAATWNMTRTWDNSAFSALSTRWEPRVTLELAQPLLRDGWPEFNLAQLRIARLNHKVNLESFRQEAEAVIGNVIATYWQLAQAIEELNIQRELLEMTIETRDRVWARADLDATDVEKKQSEAAVESRRALVVRGEKKIKDVADALSRLLADEQINVLANYDIVPTTPLAHAPVRVDVTDQLLAALRHNPLLAQARLAIALAAVNVSVAKNQVLPRLDFTTSVAMQGLAGKGGQATQNMLDGDFISYTFGLTAEYPLGNRERLADLRRRKLQRTRAVTDLQNASDQLAVQVKERVRQINTSLMEMQIQAAAVQAHQAETDALRELVRTKAMSPELLQLQLSSQLSLAASQIAQLAAVTDYNIAQVDLARVTGTMFELHGVQLALPMAIGEADWPGPPDMPARTQAQDATTSPNGVSR